MRPVPYSDDLRWRIVWLSTEHQLSPADVSTLLCVSERTVRRYMSQFINTGEVAPIKQRHGPDKLLGDFEQLLLLRLILQNPGIYLHEIKDRLLSMFGVTVTTATICRTLKFMGCTRQIIKLRAKFMAEVSVYDPSMLV